MQDDDIFTTNNPFSNENDLHEIESDNKTIDNLFFPINLPNFTHQGHEGNPKVAKKPIKRKEKENTASPIIEQINICKQLESSSKPKINIMTSSETKTFIDANIKETKAEVFCKAFKQKRFKNKLPDGVRFNDKTGRFEKSPEFEYLEKEFKALENDENLRKEKYYAKPLSKDLSDKVRKNPEKANEIIIETTIKKTDEKEALKLFNQILSKELKSREKKDDEILITGYDKEKSSEKSNFMEMKKEKKNKRGTDRDHSFSHISPLKGNFGNHFIDLGSSDKISLDKSNTTLPGEMKDIDFNFTGNFNYIVGDSSMPRGGSNNKRYLCLCHNITQYSAHQIDSHTYTLTDFADKIISDFRQLSEENVHIDMLNFLSCVDSSIYVDKNFPQQYIKFRDIVMKSDNRVIADVLFYYIWVHKNIIESSKKLNNPLQIFIEEKVTNRGSGKYSNRDKSLRDNNNSKLPATYFQNTNPLYQRKTTANFRNDLSEIPFWRNNMNVLRSQPEETNKKNDENSKVNTDLHKQNTIQCTSTFSTVLNPSNEFLNKKRPHETIISSSNLYGGSKKLHRENENATISYSSKVAKANTSVMGCCKENIQAMIDNDEKYNMLKKILPTIKSRESLEKCGLKGLIGKDKFEEIEAMLSDQSKRNLEIEVYSTDYYRVHMSLDLKRNVIQISQSLKNSTNG